MMDWVRGEDWTVALVERDHITATAEIVHDLDSKRWSVTVRVQIRGALCDDSWIRSPSVFDSSQEAETWCECVIEALAGLMPKPQKSAG